MYGPQKKPAGIADLQKDLKAIGGIQINAILNPYAPMSEWQQAAHGALNVSMDTTIYQNFCAHLKTDYQIPTIECPYPVGINATLVFYEQIAQYFGISPKKVEQNLAHRLKKARANTRTYQKLFKGRPLLYNIATSVDFTVSNSAKEGLLFLDLFRELGFDITLLIQGNPEKENHTRMSAVMKRLKVTEPFKIFGHCGDAYRAFPKKGPAVIFGSPLLREQAARFGHAFMDFTELSIGIAWHLKNVTRIATVIKELL
jgi:hypothetical protein